MARRRQQNKSTGAILRASTQQTNNTNTSSSATTEKKRLDGIALINLILTAIIGIGGLGVGLYLNNQNERIQIEIVNLQANLQRQANFAQLEVICTENCYHGFQIKNSGLAIANKVRIAIYINSIEEPWSKSIDDISQFRLNEEPRALNFLVKETKITAGDVRVSKNNAFLLALDNLPPGETVYISIFPDFTNFGRTNLYTFVRKNVTIYLEKLYNGYSTDFIYPYFDGKFKIATFDVSTNCDNCNGNTIYNSNPSISTSLTVSSVNEYDSDSTNFQMQKIQNGYKLTGITIKTIYRLPSGTQIISAPDPLHLQLLDGGTNNEKVVECQPSDCTQFPDGYPGTGG